MKTNNYPNWLVSVEQAIKLKEIGFEEDCVFYTRVPKKRKENLECVISVCHDPYDRILSGINNRHHIETTTTFGVSIPTWEQVLEWFRGKGFIGVIDYYFDEEKNRPFYKGSIKNFHGELIFEATEIGEYKEAREWLVYQLIDEWKKVNEKILNKHDWAIFMSGVLSM